ncbi:RDD family protein [Archangium sp.]|uniref:RDD family protein n=1 Tax=Archangium sp. TaxID=1872627 RepID=UPI002D3EB2B8|nr:RDD family protein [Archangium sp.]HYO56940.1 RDD family protein [Archangium sp.]
MRAANMGAMYSQPDPTLTQHPGAFCATHVELRAATICTRCGSYACDLCLRVGNDRQDYCFRCVPALERLAAPGTRLAAVLVDRFATLILPLFIGLLLGGMFDRGSNTFLPVFLLLGGLGSFAMLGFQLYLLATTGQSLGKRAMGIKVVRTDGSPVDLGRLILLRNVVPMFIGVATCNLFTLVDPLFIFSAERRCLHDHLADTKVIMVGEHTR